MPPRLVSITPRSIAWTGSAPECDPPRESHGRFLLAGLRKRKTDRLAKGTEIFTGAAIWAHRRHPEGSALTSFVLLNIYSDGHPIMGRCDAAGNERRGEKGMQHRV